MQIHLFTYVHAFKNPFHFTTEVCVTQSTAMSKVTEEWVLVLAVGPFPAPYPHYLPGMQMASSLRLAPAASRRRELSALGFLLVSLTSTLAGTGPAKGGSEGFMHSFCPNKNFLQVAFSDCKINEPHPSFCLLSSF